MNNYPHLHTILAEKENAASYIASIEKNIFNLQESPQVRNLWKVYQDAVQYGMNLREGWLDNSEVIEKLKVVNRLLLDEMKRQGLDLPN